MGNECNICEGVDDVNRDKFLTTNIAESIIPIPNNQLDLDFQRDKQNRTENKQVQMRKNNQKLKKTDSIISQVENPYTSQHTKLDVVQQNNQKDIGMEKTNIQIDQKNKTENKNDKILSSDTKTLNLKQEVVNVQVDSQKQFEGIVEKRQMIQFSNGLKYQGQWVGNTRQGHGTQVWPDGAKYVGRWYNNKAYGKGKFYHVNGDIYQGQWKQDKANGYGIYTHCKTLAKYQGQWKDDMQHGQGIQQYADGNKYQGSFKQGRRNGKGRYQFADGAIYVGQWVDGKIQGQGTCIWPDKKKYQGSWIDNKKDGKGKYCWPDGRCYEGEYKNDLKHGYGAYTWSDGRKYVGQWINDKRHGKGKYYSGETARQGVWQEDRRVKWLQGQGKQNYQFGISK